MSGNPKLRWPVDIQMHQAGSERVLVIRCPIGISEKPLVLVSAVAPIIGEFEGNKSIDDIVAKFSSYGVTRALVDQLISLLDQHYFLANDRFFTAQENVKLDFLKATIRPAALAGLSYSNNPSELSRELEGYMSLPLQDAYQNSLQASPGELAMLVSPHIDYRRGGSCYGRAYQQLKNCSSDLLILMGTAHQYSSLLFHLTKKDFHNPLGTLPCDTLFVEKLSSLYGSVRSFADELLHRREHSLELQLPFLSLTKPGTAIIPILVGNFAPMIAAGKYPEEIPEYDQFAAALTETIQASIKNGKKVSFIAGVDMAHVGQHFGDQQPLSAEFMELVALRDREYLDAIVSNDKAALYKNIADDGDARRICGFPTLYTILDVHQRLGWRISSKIIDYQQAVDYQSDCAVTFAALTSHHAN